MVPRWNGRAARRPCGDRSDRAGRGGRSSPIRPSRPGIALPDQIEPRMYRSSPIRSSRACTAAPRSDRAAPGVAAPGLARLVAGGEPVLALRGRAVRPGLAVDPSLELLLDPVVADGCGGVQAVRDVCAGQLLEEPGVAGVLRPDPGQAVGL